MTCWFKSPDCSAENSGSVLNTLMAHKPPVTLIPGHRVLFSPPYCMHVVHNIHVGQHPHRENKSPLEEKQIETGLVAQNYHHSIWEAEARGLPCHEFEVDLNYISSASEQDE